MRLLSKIGGKPSGPDDEVTFIWLKISKMSSVFKYMLLKLTGYMRKTQQGNVIFVPSASVNVNINDLYLTPVDITMDIKTRQAIT